MSTVVRFARQSGQRFGSQTALGFGVIEYAVSGHINAPKQWNIIYSSAISGIALMAGGKTICLRSVAISVLSGD